MKLHIPFLKRERYILLKACTPVEYLVSSAPLAVAKDIPQTFPKVAKNETGFATCYGRVASLKRSVTIPAPCEMDIVCTGDTWQYVIPMQDHFFAKPQPDRQFESKDMFISKMVLPWTLTCNKPDMNFVLCSHILNDTGTHLTSGVLSFFSVRALSLFNYIPKKVLNYHISFRKPLASLYPLSDLPLYIECEFNPSKFNDYVNTSRNRPTFKNSDIHLLKSKKNKS